MPQKEFDAIVVGAGPNGLAAAITLARAGRSVLVYEANETIGGGIRSAELTLPGFIHDICSTVQALTVVSPFFKSIPLTELGVELVTPDAALAHPLDDGTAAVLYRSMQQTCATLGDDAKNYRRLIEPLVKNSDQLNRDLLGPLPLPPHHPLTFARFALPAIMPARALAEFLFGDEHARGLFAGIASHTMLPLENLSTAAYGMALALAAHVTGWPIVKGGSQRLADALGKYLQSLGGEIITNHRVESIDELPAARAYLFDVTPRQLVNIAGKRLPDGYRRALEKFRYGQGAFKIDLALSGPIPWKAKECRRAGTVHLGGTLAEIAQSERESAEGKPPEKPYMLVVQQTLFDQTRAPQGKHTVWAYCHVPNGSTFDMTERMLGQLERFAPGFRDCIIGQHVMTPAWIEAHNNNYVGGDINGGAADLLQLYTRPTLSLNPYRTAARGIYLCSSSTPPGGGVHGMCGYHAARTALSDLEKIRSS
ncbi:MAG: NAD(P)/FAD-dependent oxidoreductase [Chloroflexi bacterium]|nr:NAD(P)/FAD-dependent oxidoreductase [Chloroflexota bacterium]